MFVVTLFDQVVAHGVFVVVHRVFVYVHIVGVVYRVRVVYVHRVGVVMRVLANVTFAFYTFNGLPKTVIFPSPSPYQWHKKRKLDVRIIK
jgi:hypothetical protein